MNHSEWNLLDLHIHSKFSDKVKKNDYSGNGYTAVQLLNKLNLFVRDNEKQKMIFSITDHNCVDIKLYEELSKEIKNDEYRNLNYIIGVELDIKDSSIYSDIFHCLLYFDTYELDKIESVMKSIFDSCNSIEERGNEENYPNIAKIFKKIMENGIENFILIPHYNRKAKGIKVKEIDEALKRLCFNAFEDSNNITQIQNSLKVYLEDGYDDFPFVAFSDNHNLNEYPFGKNRNKDNIGYCYVLGNIEFPFSSLKTAFEEPRLRISIRNGYNIIEEMRSIEYPKKYLKEIDLNGQHIIFSPYQNTIIGRFGSGKSLLLQSIKEGYDSLQNNPKYKQIYRSDGTMKIRYGESSFNSINEIRTVEKNSFFVFEFLQQEKYYYKNSFDKKELCELMERCNFRIQPCESIKIPILDTNIVSYYDQVKSFLEDSHSNNINYKKAFSHQTYYNVMNKESEKLDNIIDKLKDVKNKNEDVLNLKINNINVFTDSEQQNIKSVISMIDRKYEILEYYNSNFEENLSDSITTYSEKNDSQSAKNQLNIFKQSIDKFVKCIKELKDACKEVDSLYNEKIFEQNMEEKIKHIYQDYAISYSYQNEDTFTSLQKYVFKKDFIKNDDLFQTCINSFLQQKDTIKNNSTFNAKVKKFNEMIDELFTENNVKYDILYRNDSMLKKSAGQKSSLFIKLIFELIEQKLEDKKQVLLIMDQPEDNMDNKNIYHEIATKIKNLKMKYNNLQLLLVTHNANVGITADSENIIIAKEDENNNFVYETGCIENEQYIDKVCNILEGGKKAMEIRSMKYGVNKIKRVGIQNEV